MYTIQTAEYNVFNIRAKPVLGEYVILNDTPDTSNGESGYYRSIVLSADTLYPLAFSPVRATPLDLFLKNNSISSDEIQVNEIIEGTMINLFYLPDKSRWEIATKSAVGGNYWYYRTQYNNPGTEAEEPALASEQLTFREMFLDAFRVELDTPLDKVPCIAALSKDFSYCFVLQHPANHIVLDITCPRVWLVGMYAISENISESGYIVENIPQWRYPEFVPELLQEGIVQIPQTYGFPYDVDLTELVNIAACWEPNFLGYMFTNTLTGERSSLENPNYSRLCSLRGNHPNLQYQYYVLLRMGKVAEFLWYFPRYKKLFSRFYEQYHQFITAIHNTYVGYYIQKSPIARSLDKTAFPKKCFVHAARIHHRVYIPSLSSPEGKTIIRRSVVRKYVETLEPRELLFSINSQVQT